MKKYISIFCSVLSMLLAVFFTANTLQTQQQERIAQLQILNRIALDLPHINLANAFLSHSGNEDDIKQYIVQLNQQLAVINLVEVIAIDGIANKAIDEGMTTIELVAPSRNIAVVFSPAHQYSAAFFIVVLLFAALASVSIVALVRIRDIKMNKLSAVVSQNNSEQAEQVVSVIRIDLNNKTLGLNTNNELAVALANKPLCFYLALIEFCVAHPNVTLNQNKDLPDELIELANKYFYRLTQLGHTIRKRPNFSNSLEKTLSEIRAALDELLIENPELKDIYYPPKAHGEGSRSRLHSYGLSNIKSVDIEVIGK
ncbi:MULTISPECIES: hypothetical protein [Pseudoalteromonas]|uniref:hypothetical protein n=1 Tax=Pseudoalteromonas TaxID=53246 RepID=UPI0003650FBF|nr:MULTISPECIES: hypothetical protein [Pseudoalteromonas]TMN72637.1 hypothetical protein CWB85_06440 [Pseudoalteromonas sp. S1727]